LVFDWREQVFLCDSELEKALAYIIMFHHVRMMFSFAVINACYILIIFSLDAFRFAYFARASLDYLVRSGKHPDILHIHNWQTAIVGPLFWEVFADQVKHEEAYFLWGLCSGLGFSRLWLPRLDRGTTTAVVGPTV